MTTYEYCVETKIGEFYQGTACANTPSEAVSTLEDFYRNYGIKYISLYDLETRIIEYSTRPEECLNLDDYTPFFDEEEYYS